MGVQGMSKDAIPAGSFVPDESGETTIAEPVEEVEEETGDAGEVHQEVAEQTPLEKELENLKKVIGRQGQELGELRKQSQSKEEPAAEANYDSLEAEIADKLDAGEIGLSQALKEISQLASKRGADEAARMFRDAQSEEKSKEAVKKFRSQNPDFDEVKESGVLDEIMAENPLHDPLSAYLEYKNQQMASTMEERIAAATAAAKKEGAQAAAQSTNASKVLGKKGDNVRNTQPKSYASQAERKAGMVERLRAMRQEQ